MARKRPPTTVDHSTMPECGLTHQRFSKCADGVDRTPGARARRNKAASLEGAGAVAAVTVAAPAPAVTEPPTSPVDVDALAQVELITDPVVIASLTPDDLKRQLLLRAAIDEAAIEHAKAEEESGVKLNRPQIMRRTNEKAAQILLNQLDHTLAQAEVTRHIQEVEARGNKSAFIDALKRGIPADEVEKMRETIAGIPAARDKKAADARDAEAQKTHVNGQAIWICENEGSPCYRRQFRAADLDVIRRRAKAEPNWRFVCPMCKGNRVRLADLQEVA